MTTTLDYVNFYVEKGWKVFPIKPKDKKPLFPNAHPEGDPLYRVCKGGCGKYGHGLYDATCDINTIKSWVEQYPEMNIGLATGKESNVFVLDVDAGHGGFESLDAIERQYGPLPKTPTVQTGGGGRHYFFKHPGFDIRNVQNSGKLGKGLDVRGDGGYVVAAGSTHSNGVQYRWITPPSQVQVAEAPQWMISLLTSESAPQIQNHVQDTDQKAAIPNGGRNNFLTSLAGSMRRRGMTPEAILQSLLLENKAKCIPTLSDAEVKRIAESVTRYQPSVEFEANRDRLQTEWSFCKSIFEFPSNSPDFAEVLPEMFEDHSLRDFWKGIQGNLEPTAAAVNAGILTELERYKDYDVSRIDGYARSIQRFSHLAKIEKLGETLKIQAREANDSGIEKAINEINRLPSQIITRTISIADVANELEVKIRERAKNPTDIWGIPYAWKRISKLTGGKQKGELILCAAEPKIGKSWWWLQDSLETSLSGTPAFYWCGEMKRTQLMMRFYQLFGVNGRNMKTGNMSPADWNLLNQAKETLLKSPLYIDDKPLALHEIRPLLVKQKQENGIEQAVFDYAKLIRAPGRDEIEQTQNVTIELKQICQELDLSITVIQSVNKMGMDKNSEIAAKSNVRGSGQQIHDADVIYIMTKFDGSKYGNDYGVFPSDYDSVVSLHITAGRELDHQVENGFIPYQRSMSPKFKELRK